MGNTASMQGEERETVASGFSECNFESPDSEEALGKRRDVPKEQVAPTGFQLPESRTLDSARSFVFCFFFPLRSFKGQLAT